MLHNFPATGAKSKQMLFSPSANKDTLPSFKRIYRVSKDNTTSQSGIPPLSYSECTCMRHCLGQHSLTNEKLHRTQRRKVDYWTAGSYQKMQRRTKRSRRPRYLAVPSIRNPQRRQNAVQLLSHPGAAHREFSLLSDFNIHPFQVASKAPSATTSQLN